MRYSAFEAHVKDGLADGGFTSESGKLVLVAPGPNDPENYPGRFVVLTRIGGPGLQVDGLIDGVGYQVKSVGDQHHYAESEGLAILLDSWFLNGVSRMIHGEWVVGIARVGSPPVPLLVDDADRTHFVCNYVTTVKSVVR